MANFVSICLMIGCVAFTVVALVKLVAVIKERKAKKKADQKPIEEEKGE